MLHCSVSAAWCFGDQRSDCGEAVPESFRRGHQAVVPPVWVLETVNVLVRAKRRSLLTQAATSHFFELCSSLPIVVEAGPASIAASQPVPSLARQHSLSACDAGYLELAQRTGMPLATQDRSLRDARRRSGVRLFDPR